jgi:hypothetical protein
VYERDAMIDIGKFNSTMEGYLNNRRIHDISSSPRSLFSHALLETRPSSTSHRLVTLASLGSLGLLIREEKGHLET